MISWKKVVCTLRFTIHDIDLHRPMMSKYNCKWEIESNKGETDVKIPNNQDKLEFESNFEQSLTFFINQKDNTIRPKKLKLFLYRLKENDKETLYGKLVIDISKFYQKEDSTNTFVRDMESGRSIAPTFNGSFNLYSKVEDSQELVGDNIDDPKFQTERDTELPISIWDLSLVGDDENDIINEIKQNNKNKTLAEDAKLVKKTEEAEKKEFLNTVKIYTKSNETDKNNSASGNKTSSSADVSDEELEKDNEINNTGSDKKEEDSISEDENILTANDDDLDDAFTKVRITAENAPKFEEEEEKDDTPKMNYTEVVKKKKKYMVIKEAKTDDDVMRVQLDQGPLAEQVTRQRRVTFNFAEGSKKKEEDIINAVKKKMKEESGKEPTDEEIKQQIHVSNRRTSLTFTKPGVDENSVGAKINLSRPAKPRLSVPTVTLNITPGVKGSVGVTNLNLPSRDNSAVASSPSSPRNRDVSASLFSKESEMADSSSQQPFPSTSTSDQESSTGSSPPKIRKAQSFADGESTAFPKLFQPPGVTGVNIPTIGAKPPGITGVGATPGVGVGATAGVGAMPNVGVGARPGIGAGIQPGIQPGVGAGIQPGIGVQPGVGVGARPGVGAGIQPGVGVGAGVGVKVPGIGINVSPSLLGVPPLAGIPQLVGANPLNLPNQRVIGNPNANLDFTRQKRMTQPALNTQNPGLQNNQFMNPRPQNQQAFSGNNSPRYAPGTNLPNQNSLRQSTQPNQPTYTFTSGESGQLSEQLDEESGSSKSLNSALQQQILNKQRIIQQQQQQLQNRQMGQVRLPSHVTSVTSSTNPNFINVPIIPGLPKTAISSTSGSPSPRSPTTASIQSNSPRYTGSGEVSEELSTASFESPRQTPTPTPTSTNTTPLPKSSFDTLSTPTNLSQPHQQYTTTRRRSSMINVPVEQLPTEIQQKIAANSGETKNIDVEYEYEYEYEEYDDNEAQRAEEEKRKAEKLAQEERKMAANFSYCLHVIITHQWHMMSNPPKFAPDRAYPSQVFPIFATILHSKILKNEKTVAPQARQQHQINFDKCLQIFATDLTKMPATHGDLFLTILLLILLIRTQAPRYKLDRKRCETALKTIQHTFESALLLILERSLDKAEVYVELFSEANFNQQKILADFHEIFEANKTAFVFGEVINNFLITRFTELLEGKMLNRIVAKPDKFTFGNAVKWNSLLTALENDNNIQMKTIHQAVNVFIMIESISKTPSLASEVCPDISPALVSFFITHFKKDENIQNLPKPNKFNKEFKLNKAPKTFEHVPSKKTALTITTVKQEFTLDNWNDCSADEPNVKAFSFLSKYIKANEQLYPPSALSTQDVS